MSNKNSTKDQMSPRERILAALQAQPVDCIPFVPLIDTYAAHKYGCYDSLGKEKENEHG